jgi:SAM-dependent methyltransferase
MNETQQVMDRKRYAYGLDVVGQIAPSRHALLDIGCGPGTFLEVARERGWGVTGLEWNSWCVRRVRSMGIDVVEVPIEQTGFQAGSFSCVSAWSVLEHVLNPAAFLQRIHRVLCDGGALLVMVPNIESLLVRVLHERAATFCGEMHVNFFSADTLRQMLERCGFEVVICETFLTELGTVNNYLSFEDPYFGEAASVLDAVTPAWIHEKLMGSQLFAVARALPARPTVRTRE